MPQLNTPKGLDWRRRTTGKELAVWGGWLIGTAIVVYAWQLISEKTVWFFVQDAGRQAADIGSRMMPPKWSYMEKLWWPVWDTISIATLGTLIALAIAVPVAFLAARNTTPHGIVRAIALFIIVSSRSVNSLIWALMLVFIFGPGVLAGTIAIGLRSVGFCAKLLYEAIEEIDQKTAVKTLHARLAEQATSRGGKSASIDPILNRLATAESQAADISLVRAISRARASGFKGEIAGWSTRLAELKQFDVPEEFRKTQLKAVGYGIRHLVDDPPPNIQIVVLVAR